MLKQLIFDYKIFNLIKKYNIDLCLGVSVSIAHASIFTKAKSIVFDDDDQKTTPGFALLSHTFADFVFSPESLIGKSLKRKYFYHDSFHELAYLHPNIFKPDRVILTKYGINPSERYSIVRFNSFKAHHDIGQYGLSKIQKQKLVASLAKYGNVYISSEDKDYQFNKGIPLSISPEDFHHLLAFTSCYAGESQTIASEAAILGVPSFRCNTFKGKLSYLDELEHHYGLTYSYLPSEFAKFLKDIESTMENPNSLKLWKDKQKKLISEKINLTAFLKWFIRNWPQSIKVIHTAPDYQKRFI